MAFLEQPQAPRLLQVRAETRDERQILRFRLTGRVAALQVTRDGGELVLAFGAALGEHVEAPPARSPIQAVAIETAEGTVRIRVGLPSSARYEVQRQHDDILLLIDATAPSRTIFDLYRGLFPATGEGGTGEAFVGAPSASSSGAGEGFAVGALTLRPTATLGGVWAESTAIGPRPVTDRYLELAPRLAADLTFGAGRLTGAYAARLRRGAREERLAPVTRSTTHLVDTSLELPLGPFILFQVASHHATGVLETSEVDPGFEYFFDLGRFRRHQVDASLRYVGPGRVGLAVGGSVNSVDLDDRVPGGSGRQAAFFDYETRGARAALVYELGPTLRSSLGFSHEKTSAPTERPLAAATVNAVSLSIDGELSPVTRADVALGFERRRAPGAAGNEPYAGLGLAASLRRELASGAVVELGASRATRLSGFEGNAFYVASAASLQATHNVPLGISLRAGAGYHWNSYRVASASLGEPRSDRILGWNVGIGRVVSPWIFVRADYGQQRRRSNLHVFDTRTRSVTFQVGLTPGARR